MEYFVLLGGKNSGKTAALHFVHEILIADDSTVLTHIELKGTNKHRDFMSKLIYHEKKIVVFTAGDVPKYVDEAVSITGFDFYIFACNRDHESYLDKILPSSKVHKFSKTPADTLHSRLAANWYDAIKIVEQLN
jgi:hypothetical protein